MTPSRTSRRPPARDARADRLEQAVRSTGGWLLAQGLLCLVLGERLAGWLALRYAEAEDPYLRFLGLCLCCLGIFVLKALREPRRQYLAVDLLILLLFGQVYFLLDFRLSYDTLTPFEWFSAAANLGLGAALALNRTRSAEMAKEAASLAATPATEWFRQIETWVRRRGPAPRPTLGAWEAKEAEAPPAAPKPAKGSSEALPHLD